MVADDGMTIGRVDSFKNLFLLVGPPFNGWKLGFGAAALLAQSLEGETLEVIDQSVVDAFSPKNRVVKSLFWSKVSIARNL